MRGRRKEGKKGVSIESIDQEATPRGWRSTIVLNCGARICSSFNFLDRAAIKTTVLPRAYVELCSELRGKKWFGIKPIFPMPAITYFHKVIAQGHMKEGVVEKKS
jgi:hypothetical protein